MLAKARGAARAEGFADGVAQAENNIDRELENQLASLATTIEVAQADRQATTKEMTENLHKIVSIFLNAIAPHFGEAALIDEIAEVLTKAVHKMPEETLRIEVCPDISETVSSKLEQHGLSCAIMSNGALTKSEARIHWQGGFDSIDMNSAISSAKSILASHLGGQVEVSTGSLAPLFESDEPDQGWTE